MERLALLQLALSSTIFLLDMIRLPDVLPVKTFKEFMHFLFGSRNNLKLGNVNYDHYIVHGYLTTITYRVNTPTVMCV